MMQMKNKYVVTNGNMIKFFILKIDDLGQRYTIIWSVHLIFIGDYASVNNSSTFISCMHCALFYWCYLITNLFKDESKKKYQQIRANIVTQIGSKVTVFWKW